jgi:hypothetical protein
MVRRSGFLEWAPPTNRFGGRPPTHQFIVVASDIVAWSDAAVVLGEDVVEGVDTIVFADAALGGLGNQAEAVDTLSFSDSAEGDALALYGAGEDTIVFSDSGLSTSARIAVATDTRTPTDSAVAAGTVLSVGSDSLTLSDSGVGSISGASDPYTYWTAFNKNLFPPQSAGGVWGAQSPINEVVMPTITSSGTAGTFAQLRDALYTPGTEVTLTASILGSSSSQLSFDASNIADVRVIVPDPYIFGWAQLGAVFPVPYPYTINRLHICGDGQIHRLEYYVAAGSGDLAWGRASEVLKGSGPGGNRGCVKVSGTGTPRALRGAFTNMLMNCGGYGYIGEIGDLTVVNCSVMTGNDLADPRESWAFRAAHEALGNLVFYGNDLRKNPGRVNNAHHLIRCHPDPGLLYTWVYNNTIINRPENRMTWFDAPSGTGSGIQRAGWVQASLLIGENTSGGGPGGIDGPSQQYAYVLGNDIRSPITVNAAGIAMSGTILTDKTSIPNTFAGAAGTNPAWSAFGRGPGDPTGIAWNF